MLVNCSIHILIHISHQSLFIYFINALKDFQTELYMQISIFDKHNYTI